MTAQELIDYGFEKHGNWYIYDKLSINLFARTLKYIRKSEFASIEMYCEFEIKSMTIEKLLNTLKTLNEL